MENTTNCTTATKGNCACKKEIKNTNAKWIVGKVEINNTEIPQISTKLSISDTLGAIKVRWSIGRNNFKIPAGLYAVGTPEPSSDIFVTANYKLSFDHLRKNLDGLNAWILVLDTKGVNVWCAAGKRTFGTNELINRIETVKLKEIVTNRTLILPQLGAVGIAAHQVRLATGFRVIYGPVRASDIKEYLNNKYKATPEMRLVTFNLADRVKLIPVDFIYNAKRYLFLSLLIVLIASSISPKGILFNDLFFNGFASMLVIISAFISGVVLCPILLPILPFKSFALKGAICNTLVFGILYKFYLNHYSPILSISLFLCSLALSSFISLNFTGSSTFTSLSGVQKEMKIALPLQIGFASLGLLGIIVGNLAF